MRRPMIIIGLSAALAQATGGCAMGDALDGDGEWADSVGAAPKGDDPDGGDGGGGPGSDDGGDDGGDPNTAVDEAKDKFPTYLDLHEKVIVRTCTPTEGVCHNEKEYPDLHTPQTMLGAAGQPCNFAEEDPLSVFSGCEPKGDEIMLTDGPNAGFSSEVAYVELVMDDDEVIGALVHLRDPMPGPMGNPYVFEGFSASRTTAQGAVPVGAISGHVSYSAGDTAFEVQNYTLLEPSDQELLTSDLRGGDLNQDGIFGASEDPYLLVDPGLPDTSYLLARLQGTVPGSPMPLANQPLSSAEIVAMACWIEGLVKPDGDSVYSAIDYDDCLTAEEFGGGDPDSGYSLSADIQPIFDAHCTAGGCHSGAEAVMGLDLTPGNSRDNLLEKSLQDPSKRLIEAGNPTNSYLVTKLTGNGVAGVQMPRDYSGKGGELPDEDISVIREWIIAGAPDD